MLEEKRNTSWAFVSSAKVMSSQPEKSEPKDWKSILSNPKELRTGLPQPQYVQYQDVNGCKRARLNYTKGASTQVAVTATDPALAKDIQVLKLRGLFNPKRYYKNLDSVSKSAQLGTVIEGRTEFFSGRIPKKQRKQTLVDEILADKDIRDLTKRKFDEIQKAKQLGKKGWHRDQKNKRKAKWARS